MSQEPEIVLSIMPGTDAADVVAGTAWFANLMVSMKEALDSGEFKNYLAQFEGMTVTLHPRQVDEGTEPYFGTARSGHSFGFTEYLWGDPGKALSSEGDQGFWL